MDQTTWAWCTTHLKVISRHQVVPTRTAKSRLFPKVWSTLLLVQMRLILNCLRIISAQQQLTHLKPNRSNPSRARVPPKKRKTLRMETVLKRTPNSKRNNLERTKKRNPRIKSRSSWVTWLPCILIRCKCSMAAKEVIRYLLACRLDSNKECHIHHSIRSQECLFMDRSPVPWILSVTPQGKEPVISKLDNITEVVQRCSRVIKINLCCQLHQAIWRTSNCLGRSPCSQLMQETLQRVVDQIKDWVKELGLIRIRLPRIIFCKPPLNALKILAHSHTKTVRQAKIRLRRSTFRYTRGPALPRMHSANLNKLKFHNLTTTSPWWSITSDLLFPNNNNYLAPIRKIRMCLRRKRLSVKNWSWRRRSEVHWVLCLLPSRYLQTKRTWPPKMLLHLEQLLTPNNLSDLWVSDNLKSWKILEINSKRR